MELLGGPSRTTRNALAAAAELGVLYQRLGLVDRGRDPHPNGSSRSGSRPSERITPSSLTSLNQLADLLFSQGRIDEVEPLDRKTLEIRRRVLGEDHPDTQRSLNGLAATLHNRGRYDEAAPLFQEGLDYPPANPG